MKKKLFNLGAIAILLLIIIPISPKADEKNSPSQNEVFQFLEQAFYAQVALTESDRSMKEIEILLDPYFSKSYQKQFLAANLYEENGKYRTYGSDFSPYFIPYYRFSDKTKIVIDQNKIYVFEHFAKDHTGPVGYEDHYEGILIEKDGEGWIISRYLYNDVPKKIIDKSIGA